MINMDQVLKTNKNVVVSLALVVCYLFVGSFGLSCFHCDKNSCPTLLRDKCVHGVAKDVCGCCDVCARGEGEVCGGILYDPHSCVDGTKCIVELAFGLPYYMYIQMNGTCKSTNSTDGPPCEAPKAVTGNVSNSDNASSGDSALEKCRVACSIDFCASGQNRICSANGSSVVEVPERTPCQHTTCNACRFVTDPDCPSCHEPARKTCLHEYYLCVSEHYKNNDTILELNDPRIHDVTGKVFCHVPDTSFPQVDSTPVLY